MHAEDSMPEQRVTTPAITRRTWMAAIAGVIATGVPSLEDQRNIPAGAAIGFDITDLTPKIYPITVFQQFPFPRTDPSPITFFDGPSPADFWLSRIRVVFSNSALISDLEQIVENVALSVFSKANEMVSGPVSLFAYLPVPRQGDQAIALANFDASWNALLPSLLPGPINVRLKHEPMQLTGKPIVTVILDGIFREEKASGEKPQGVSPDRDSVKEG